MELLTTLAEHAATPVRRVGSPAFRQRRRTDEAAACRPGEHSHADQARSGGECPATCPVARHSAATGTVVDARTRGIAPPPTGGAHELGNGKRQGPAGRFGARRYSLGRPDHTRSVAWHCRTRCAGAAVCPDQCSPRVSAALEHSFAPRHDLAGTARPLTGARNG